MKRKIRIYSSENHFYVGLIGKKTKKIKPTVTEISATFNIPVFYNANS